LGCGRPWKERTATCLSARRVVGEHGDWTAKEEISRKKKKKRKTYQQRVRCSPHIIAFDMLLQSVVGPWYTLKGGDWAEKEEVSKE